MLQHLLFMIKIQLSKAEVLKDLYKNNFRSACKIFKAIRKKRLKQRGSL